MRIKILLFLLFFSTLLRAQHDSAYYYSYKSKITARFYLSNKATSLRIRDIDGLYNLTFRPNTSLNLGIGATYKSYTLNLGYGFGFLNPVDGKGKTKYLDLQFHRYSRRVILDVFGQFYHGFYLSPKGYAMKDKTYYLRPDLRVNELGSSVQYVFNSKRFSYRAAFLQNEWQRKSAGSFLLGLEGYAGYIVADSSIFPTALDSKIAARNYREIDFFEMGFNLGYAYTLVIKKHFFMTGSASTGIDIGTNIIMRGNVKEKVSGISPNTFFRASVGYNSYLWAMSVLYVTNNVNLAHDPSEKKIQLNTSNLRLNLIRRIGLGKNRIK